MKLMAGALALALAGAIPVAAQAQDMPGWMAGCWEMREEGGRWAEECWTIPRGGLMLGSGRAGTGGEVGSFEFMRIELGEDGMTFLASPGGNGWTAFAAGSAASGVSFIKPDHDYPQRISYWREGDLLKARVSLLDGSEAEEWTFTPMGGG